MIRLSRRVRALNRASRRLDYADAAAVAAHYAAAGPVIEAVITLRAATPAGLKVKAHALVWCAGGALDLSRAVTTEDRIWASLIEDLLAD